MASDPATPMPDLLPVADVDAAERASVARDTRSLTSTDTSDRGVALLLAVAAVVAAVITLVAANASSDASGSWQSSLRQEVARGAQAVQQIQYVYEGELPGAFQIATLEVRGAEYRAAAASAAPEVAAHLTMQADALQMTVDAMRPNISMAAPSFALSGGGYDPVRKLAAEVSASGPASYDPDAAMASGDAAAARADRLMGSLVIIGFAFLFGALAQAFGRQRRVLLVVGWIALVAGLAVALAGGLVA